MTCARLSLFLAILALGVFSTFSRANAACNNLICVCTAAVPSGVSFGTYDPTSPSDTTSTGSVTVTCVLAVGSGGSYDITLSKGNSGNYASRSMKQGSSTLAYNLYTEDGINAPIWGDGLGSTQKVIGSFSSTLLNIQTFYVYGRVPKGQNVDPGLYTDALIVTVTY